MDGQFGDFFVESLDLLSSVITDSFFVAFEIVNGFMQSCSSFFEPSVLHFDFSQFQIVGRLFERQVDFIKFENNSSRLQGMECPVRLIRFILPKLFSGSRQHFSRQFDVESHGRVGDIRMRDDDGDH